MKISKQFENELIELVSNNGIDKTLKTLEHKIYDYFLAVHGKKTYAAKALRINRTTLVERLKQHENQFKGFVG